MESQEPIKACIPETPVGASVEACIDSPVAVSSSRVPVVHPVFLLSEEEVSVRIAGQTLHTADKQQGQRLYKSE